MACALSLSALAYMCIATVPIKFLHFTIEHQAGRLCQLHQISVSTGFDST